MLFADYFLAQKQEINLSALKLSRKDERETVAGDVFKTYQGMLRILLRYRSVEYL